MNNNYRVRVIWHLKTNKSKCGHGNWFEDNEINRKLLTDWLIYADKEYPDIYHCLYVDIYGNVD